MPGSSTTVQRLERRLQLESAQALTALHATYTAVLAEIFPAARARGYLGADPLEAARALAGPAPELDACGRAAAELWLSFFGCFREDEAAYEAKQFHERAQPINRALAQLAPGQAPDAALTQAILAALDAFLGERHAAVSARIDALLAEIHAAQGHAERAALGAAHGADELARLDAALAAELAAVGSPDAAGAPTQRLERLVAALRGDAETARLRADAAEARLATLIGAVQGTDDLGELPEAARQFLLQMRKLVASRRDLEQANRDLHAKLAAGDAEKRALLEQLAAAERRTGAPEGAGDHQLELYRAVAAALESGGDWKTPLAAARSRERILRIDAAAQGRLVQVVDRQLDALARTLRDLRALAELTPDPRRLRPRLFGSDYDFRSLPGILAALADGAGDLAVYADRAAWAVGVQALARHVPRLREVFRELVALVAAWREKLGDAPPASISISLDGHAGVLALPAVLAADVEQLLRRRKAATAAAELAPLIDAGVGLYHAALADALGEAPPRSAAPKREGATAAVARLTGELTALAGRLETTFAEVARDGFRLGAAETALLADDHLLRLGLGQLDGAIGELAAAPGAPPAPPPAARGDLRELHRAIAARAAWAELIATYRAG